MITVVLSFFHFGGHYCLHCSHSCFWMMLLEWLELNESFYQAHQITTLKEYRNITEHSADDGTFLTITVYYSDPSVGARESGKGLSQCNIFV